jgi:hypothetical protein
MIEEMIRQQLRKASPNVRPLTIDVFKCLLLDLWPSPAGVTDFGIESEQHYLALRYAIEYHGLTPEQLDAAACKGEALGFLIQPDNPYFGVKFTTPWDSLHAKAEVARKAGDD